MADLNTYLNVPFSQKDEAKALGAKWDPTNKKWYVPGGLDVALFVKWQISSGSVEASATPHKPSFPASATKNIPAQNTGIGAITLPADKNFVAYDGDTPPWD